MVRAFRDGEDTYQPVFDGQDLQTECGNPVTTLNNLAKLVNGDRKVVCFYLNHGHALIVFATGETYLATGFSYGPQQDGVKELAVCAAKHLGCDHKELLSILSALPLDFDGPMPLPTGKPASGDSGRNFPALVLDE